MDLRMSNLALAALNASHGEYGQVESLNVIALISGGKDSFFSILHCMRNGHNVVALANLYPAPRSAEAHAGNDPDPDLDSFMFQTVGHTVIPLYEQALGVPLYRHQITGSAVQTGTSYGQPEASPSGAADETESLIPLLKRVMAEHPSANALSTGAILSTYQRTRVESVALRLGLTPLSFLWQYPVLPPGTQTSLLQDMEAVGLDARMVKVASGGLDDSFLWENVASGKAVRRIERAMGRFGMDGDGAVLGEGGEFETLVVDGPRSLFKERIEVQDGDWKVVSGGSGSAWLHVLGAKSVVKAPETGTEVECRIPDLFEREFEDILDSFQNDDPTETEADTDTYRPQTILPYDPVDLPPPEATEGDVLYWTIKSNQHANQSISDEAGEVMAELRRQLSRVSLDATAIISTTIILRSMQDFQAINQVYGALFTKPNPPARVTIACGTAMPAFTNLILHLQVSPSQLPLHSALHVQSRSYWAPANIGPYSQSSSHTPSSIHLAGQIPLIPASMLLLPPTTPFYIHALLALQHLFRVATASHTDSFLGATIYLPAANSSPRRNAIHAARCWALAHAPLPDSDDAPERDLWEEKHHASFLAQGRPKAVFPARDRTPPCFAVEVHELPRGAPVEWHALRGVGNSEQVRMSKEEKKGATVYRSEVGGRVYSLWMVSYPGTDEIEEGKIGEEGGACGAYWDVSLPEGRRRVGGVGVIPCMSIWDGEGRRLAAVLLFDGPRRKE